MTFPRKLIFAMQVCLGLAALATQAEAADARKWEAISKTALSITGDITLSPDRIAMAGKSFPLQLVREIADPRQAAALSKIGVIKLGSDTKIGKIGVRH